MNPESLPGQYFSSTLDTGAEPVRILVIDNYDSFVFTLVGYLRELGADAIVVRNDEITADEAIALAAQCGGVLLSPGPGVPAQAGICRDLVSWAAEAKHPLYGVCLGFQVLAETFGATVTHADELMHGKTSQLEHGVHPMFAGVPDSFAATRYHSLGVVPETVSDEVLGVTAWTPSGLVMGLAHAMAPLWGVQFHPESVLTEGGYQMLGNWLNLAGVPGAARRAQEKTPLLVQTEH